MQTIFLILAGIGIGIAAPEPTSSGPLKARVVSVYDGDTLTLDTGDKVRLRWVNTPELRPPQDYGIEAREAAKNLVLGQEVHLIYGATRRDGYGRLLAGVRTDEKDLSEVLLEQGMAHLFIIPPDDADHTKLLVAQRRARTARRGIWSTAGYQGVLHLTSFHANARGDDRQNVNGEYARVCNVSDRPVDLDGFRVTELSGRSWILPPLLLPPGHTVKIHSGQGTHQTDPASQLEIYLGSTQPIWNNTRDRITIYDRHGQMVDTWLHAPKSRQ
jgi:micrococcal nuclease